MARRSTPERRRAQGFNLIPVIGVGEEASGISDAVGDEKTGGNGVEGTIKKDMTNDEMTFEAHKQIVKPSNRTCDHIWRASVRSEKSARVCVRRGVVCTPSVALMVATVWTRNCQKEQKIKDK